MRRLLKLSAMIAFAALMVSAAEAAPTVPVKLPVVSLPIINKITSPALSGLVAMAEVEGQVLGAGKGQLVAIDGAGKVTRTIAIPIEKPAGISSYTAGKAIIGEAKDNTIYVVDLKTGSSSRLLDLRSTAYVGMPPDPLEASSAKGAIMAGEVLRSGELMSVAFDGRHIFAALSAGYSSSIFTIDPAANRAVSQAWSPGDKPVAMHFSAGNLYVLDGAGGKIRLFDSSMKLNWKPIEITAEDPRGIIVREDGIKVLSPKEDSIFTIKPDLDAVKAVDLRATWNLKDIVISPGSLLPKDYALLICGDVAQSGYDEFWNDTVWLYKTLLALGYTKERIYVLYGDGFDFNSENPAYRHPETVTDFPASIAWVDRVLAGMKDGDQSIGVSKMGANDSLLVWVFDHGGGGNTAYFCLTDGAYYDSTFAARLDALQYKQRAVFMQQCRSGGFIDNLNAQRGFASSACMPTENAHRSDNENELYNGKYYNHGEYNYHMISAISGRTPANSLVNADSNGDGRLSAREVHDYIVSHESRSETPQRADNWGVGGAFFFR